MRTIWMLAVAGLSLWAQPEPRVQFVEVEPGVQLEVLDWGGAGRPILLLGGFQGASSFAPLAAQLTDFSRVFSLSRRGVGKSSLPNRGFGLPHSATDILKVVDALRLDVKPILVGESFAGQELSRLGASHGDRFAGLVYLDSAEDPFQLQDLNIEFGEGEGFDISSLSAYLHSTERLKKACLAGTELRLLYRKEAKRREKITDFLVPRVVTREIFEQAEKPRYLSIRIPVLAFFSSRDGRHRDELRISLPTAKVIDIGSSDFYIRLSHEREIVHELRMFLGRL